MKKQSYSALSLVLAGSFLVAGCSGGIEPEQPAIESHKVSLKKAQSCADLEAMLKADALAKMHAQIDAMIESTQYYNGNNNPVYDGEVSTSVGVGTGGGEEPPVQSGGDEGDPTGQPSSSPDHSDTNTQVAGVDEADIVKTDGNFIYLLHGQSFTVLNSWPASDLGINTSLAIEGEPLEMFVADGKVVIYSSVDGTPIYDKAGVEPRGEYYEYGYYGGGEDDPYYGGYGYSLTKITVLDIEGAQAQIAKEFYFEGSYTSSRRVENQVRTILTGGAHGPLLTYWPENATGSETPAQLEAMFEALRAENVTRINQATYQDWLPYRFAKDGADIDVLQTSCDSYHVPTEGSTAYGLTQVESIDLNNLAQAPREAAIVGAVDTVYSSSESIYLAARAWNDPSVFYQNTDLPRSVTSTHIHKFDLTADPGLPQYVATGTVSGQVKNQFSLDEKDGKLRIATTDQIVSSESWQSYNHLFVMAAQGADLTPVGSLVGLAPGEQIYSTRFVGDRGYIVTFRQVDPLFVIDLSNPTAPSVMAELKIPGFSEYMHPIDENHLLTIGQDATSEGQVTGLALQIFDVTQAGAPALLHKHVFTGTDYGYSEAEYNHKAFNYYGQLGLLAFPFVGYDGQNGTMKSSLEVFKVDIASGLEKLGSVDHTSFFGNAQNGYCGGYYGVDVRRGVFIDEYVYSISYGGVIVNSIEDLTQPVASVALPAPVTPMYDCGTGF